MDRQWEVIPERLAPVLVLTVGTDRLIPLLDLSECDGVDGTSME